KLWSLPSHAACHSAMSAGPVASAAAASKLTHLARPVDVDDAPGRRCRRIDREPANDFGDLVGGRDAPERNVGYDLGAATAREIFFGHFRHREARSDREAQDSVGGITARDRSGHRNHPALRRRIMPMLRTIA